MGARKAAPAPAPVPQISPVTPLPSVEVRESGVHGLGAFAIRSIPRGQAIGNYEGRRYSPGEQAEREWNHDLTYVFGLSDGSLIDGSDGGNATRHINHSCAPNCQAFEVTSEDGELSIAIEAKRRLKKDEELSIDYQLEIGEHEPAEYPCRCGAAACRGTLAASPP